MSGVGTCLELVAHGAKKIGDRLRLFHNRVIGVYATDNVGYAVYLRRRQDVWHLEGHERIFLPQAEDLPAKLRLALAKGGRDLAPLSLCLSEEQIFTLTADFRGVDQPELKESVHWEIYGHGRFGEQNFLSIHAALPDWPEYYWLAATEEAKAAALQTRWREHDLPLWGLTALPPEETAPENADGDIIWQRTKLNLAGVDFRTEEAGYGAALFAACALISPGSLNFWPDEPLINWRNWGFFLVSAVLICLLFLAGLDYHHLQVARRAEREIQTEWATWEPTATAKREIDKILRANQARNRVLTALSAERLPWHGLLVYLGTLPADGVCLTELYLTEDGALEMLGYATDYNHLADYLAMLEKAVNSSVSLDEAQQASLASQLNFRLRLNLDGSP